MAHVGLHDSQASAVKNLLSIVAGAGPVCRGAGINIVGRILITICFHLDEILIMS
jgi:hypothetical protein